jgi:hypothetical protein
MSAHNLDCKMGESMVNYFQCSECNYQFLTTDDSHCRKCGNANPSYLVYNEDRGEVISLITKLIDNFNVQLKEMSLKIDKIENELRARS